MPVQRDADAAAERASHWCSLAQVLQRSALLSEGGGSPLRLSAASTASTASHYSPHHGTYNQCTAAGGSSAKLGRGASHSASANGACDLPGLLAEPARSPLSPCNGTRSRLRLPASPMVGAVVDGSASHGLIAAFQAVASTPGDDQLQGSPVLRRCASPSPADQRPPLRARPAGGSPTASAELVPGTRLQLLHKLPNPGLSCASSLSLDGRRTPLTPEPCAAAAGTAGARGLWVRGRRVCWA